MYVEAGTCVSMCDANDAQLVRVSDDLESLTKRNYLFQDGADLALLVGYLCFCLLQV